SSSSPTFAPQVVPLPRGLVPVAVATAMAVTCVVTSDGSIFSFGANYAGGLGRVTPGDSDTIGKLDGLGGPAVGVTATSDAFCALLRSGAVQCWGGNGVGQLGLGTVDGNAHPQPTTLVF